MTVEVKMLGPAHPEGRGLLSTNLTFMDRNNADAYTTTFHRDFPAFHSKKAKPFPKPIPAQMDHKDLRYIKEDQTEMTGSYQYHPVPKTTHIPRQTRNYTNFKMHVDHQEVGPLTTESQNLRPHPFQPPVSRIRPTEAPRKSQQGEKTPESTTQATFIPHRGCPIVKPTNKHQEEGFPTIKGDRRHHGFVSHYNSAFQGAWNRAAQSVEKHSSSVLMGDPVKIVERMTTHAASFVQPTVCRYMPPVAKEHFKLSPGNVPKESWLSTSREAFYHKLGDPVVRIKRNQNFSSLPKGDTDTMRNQERMSVTTSRVSFSDLPDTLRSVSVPGPDLMTKSRVQFGPPSLSGLYYTTTASEHYSKKDGARARPVFQLPTNILRGPEDGLSVSTIQADFPPLKHCKRSSFATQHKSNVSFPLGQQHVSTTNREDYTTKPLIRQHRSCNQFVTHFVLE